LIFASQGRQDPSSTVAVVTADAEAWTRHGPRRLVDVANGTIKRLVRDRGFGFIRDDGGQEWFFHRSSVKAGSFDQLNEGQRVSFDEEPSAKGPRAGNIRSEA
jgi:CspA family cold shock protein